MRQRIGALAVGLAVAVALVGASAAVAVTGGAGSSGDAPGQAQAAEQCFSAFLRLYEGGVAAGGGPKFELVTGEVPGIAPLNCDHFWQVAGAIGSG